MTSPAMALAASLWWRARWTLLATMAYIVLLAVGVQVYPSSAAVFCTGTLGIVFIWASLLTTLTYGPADFGSKSSGFPAHMLVLPMRNRRLVGWPMLFGGIVAAGLWCLVTWGVLHPGGLQLPIVWPALLLIATTAWVQALAWTPFPSPWLRAPLLMIAVAPNVVLAVWGGEHSASNEVAQSISAAAIGWTMVAFAVGTLGLARARRGDQPDWMMRVARMLTSWIKIRPAQHSIQVASFRSASAAHLWHEFRRNAVGVPVMVAFSAVPLLGVMALEMLQHNSVHPLMIHSMTIDPRVISLACLIGLPMMFAAMMGSNLGKFDFWGKDRMATFFAVRPMTTVEFVRLKFKAVALATVLVWALIVLLLTVWIALDLSPLNANESLLRIAAASATTKQIAAVVLCLFALPLLIWRSVIVGLWITLAGRKWFSTSVALALPLGAFFLLPGLAHWASYHPAVRDWFLEYAVWIVSGLVCVKLAAALGISMALMRRGLLSGRSLTAAFGGWLIAAVTIVAVIACFVTITPLLAAAVLLFVPVTRLLAAPLVLSWNRHR